MRNCSSGTGDGITPHFHNDSRSVQSVTCISTNEVSAEDIIASTSRKHKSIPESAALIQRIDGSGGERGNAASIHAKPFGEHHLGYCKAHHDERSLSDACESAVRRAHSPCHENSMPSRASEADDIIRQSTSVPINGCKSVALSGESMRRHGGTQRCCTPGATLEFVNLISVDSERTQAGISLLHELWAAPLTLALNLFLVYHQIPRAFKYALGFTGLLKLKS